jgi:hypothetical protein
LDPVEIWDLLDLLVQRVEKDHVVIRVHEEIKVRQEEKVLKVNPVFSD